MKLVFERSVPGRGMQYLPQCDVETVSLPSTLETVGNYAFDCTNLKSLTLPDSVTHLGAYAFALNEVDKALTLQ